MSSGILLLRSVATRAAIALLPLTAAPYVDASGGDERYIHPVVGIVVRPFDNEAGRFGPGNRGLDYLVAPSQRVSASGDGVVVFAGPVAGENFVTVLHPDGLRSSYSYLMTIVVRRGQRVLAGDTLGLTSLRFQLGFRSGDAYIDPAPLLGRALTARLVAESAARM